jgi:magnesium transporter
MASPEAKVGELMAREVKSIDAHAKSMDAARFLSKHKFMALPVLDRDGLLVGVIPADDLMMVALARLYNRYSQSVGTDAAAMERLTPFQAAEKRVPWLLGTMVIELGAALIVAHFNPILQKVILLASFMPVISAVSGNVGLQAAAITVRGLDVGPGSLGDRGKVLLKEIATTLFMAVVCGLVLGLIGGFWSRHLVFGLVIGGALTCSMVTAAFMGTLFPMVSKGLGFDPAATAGPFETAFQDMIGFGVFLGLATLFASRM